MTGRTNVKEGNRTPGELWHLYVWRNVTSIGIQRMVCCTNSPKPSIGDLAIDVVSIDNRADNWPHSIGVDGSSSAAHSWEYLTVVENSDGSTLKTRTNAYYPTETTWSRASELDQTIWQV